MTRYTKTNQIDDLILALNELREKEGKKIVTKRSTGLAYWLSVDAEYGGYNQIGRLYHTKDEFIGFLEGLLWRE